MQQQWLPRAVVIAGALLGLAVLAGCSDLAANTTGASQGSTSTGPPVVSTSSTATGPSATASPTTTSLATTTSVTSGSTPTTASIVTASAITPAEILSLVTAAGMYPAGAQIEIVDQKTFGDMAGAYVYAPDDNVYLVVFDRQGGGWVIIDHIVGLGWADMRARLVSEGATQAFLDWANPTGD